jgi:hypothetical protein
MLMEYLAQVFTSHKTWLYQQPLLIPFVLYAFLRLIAEKGMGVKLQKDFISVCVCLLTDRFKECSVIGRDLIRLLQDVSRIHEFEPIWRQLHARVSDIDDLLLFTRILKIPTPKQFVLSRLTPEMETQLVFMLESVHYGNHRRYQEWYVADHFKGRDNDPLIVDIVRFLIVAYHPTNAVLASPSIQRWQVIAWLLRLIRSNHASANAKLALFFDWLFFDPQVDSIMNIEPAMLIITKCSAKAPQITASLIEFLGLIRTHFYPNMTEAVSKCIDQSMQEILSKRVVSNLEGILLAEGLSDSIKGLVRELFPCYLQSDKTRFANPMLPAASQSQDSIHAAKGPSQTLTLTSVFVYNVHAIRTSVGDPRISPERTQSLLYEFLSSLAKLSDAEFSQEAVQKPLLALHSSVLVPLVNGDESFTKWGAALKETVFKMGIDVMEPVIQRLNRLPNCMPVTVKVFMERLLCSSSVLASPGLASGLASSTTSSSSSLATEELLAILQNWKGSDLKSFYEQCLVRHEAKLAKCDRIIDVLEILLEDLDPTQLCALKLQLGMLPQSCRPQSCLVNENTKIDLVSRVGDTVLWDGFMQLFLWDLLEASLHQVKDLSFLVSFFTDLLDGARAFLDASTNAELVLGVQRIALNLCPVPKGDGSGHFDAWLRACLETCSACPVMSSILLALWRDHPVHFQEFMSQLDPKLDSATLQLGIKKFSQFAHEQLAADDSVVSRSLLDCLDSVPL